MKFFVPKFHHLSQLLEKIVMDEIESYFSENFPGDSATARLKRCFVRCMTIKATSAHVKNQLQSFTVIKAETLRHLLFHRNVIHCFSRIRYIWDIVMMITYGLAFVFIPFDVAFCYGQRRLSSSRIFSYTISLIDIICLMDIAINFRSAYQDHRTKRIVLEGRQIARHYVRYFFWVDLLSSFPDRIVLNFLSVDPKYILQYDLFQCVNDDKMLALFQCYWDFIVIMSLLKYLRMPSFFKYLNDLLHHHKISSYVIRFIKNLLSLTFWYHFVVCLSFVVTRLFFTTTVKKEPTDSSSLLPIDAFVQELSSYDRYVVCLYYTTHTITLFASEIVERSQVDMTIALVFTLIGFVVHIWLVSKAYMILRTVYSTTVRFQEIRYQMQTFMAFKGLATATQQRILTFYDFSFRGKFFRKREIAELLGNEQRQLVTLETCQQLLTGNYIFKQIPEELYGSIANCLEEAIYLTNDVIGKVESTRTQKLHFIVSGTVAVYSEEGDELAHLHDGNMFGEVAFLLNEVDYPSLNYVATEETVLLVLLRTDFMRVLAETPRVLSGIRRSLKERYSVTDRMTESEMIESLKIQGKLNA